MKKIFLVSAFVFSLTTIFSSCSSVPENVDLTGKWQYIYGNNNLVAIVDLNQNGDKLTGTLNSSGGEYEINGKVIGDKFTFTAKNSQETITANCFLTDINKFRGRYLVDNGNSGEIMQGKRL